MDESFKEFEAASLFCARCRQANPVRKKLLLVLPTGRKYDYTCSVCGTAVGGKTDNDASEFYRSAPAPAASADLARRGPPRRLKPAPPAEGGRGR